MVKKEIMRKTLDVIGKKFNRLFVLSEAPRIRFDKRAFYCLCDCGNKTIVNGSNLVNGHIKSCGCLRVDVLKSAYTKHGNATAGNKTPTYISWKNMRQRCLNPRHPQYPNYGGRGISVCERWINSFENFLSDMGERPPDLSIDRYPDNNGNYEPSNCRWGTDEQQAGNTRTNRWLEYNGERMILNAWARKWGVSDNTVRDHLRKGKPFSEVYKYFNK
jgi:hypothetical protein